MILPSYHLLTRTGKKWTGPVRSRWSRLTSRVERGEIGTGQSKDWEEVAEDGEENVYLRPADANGSRAPFEGLRSFGLPMKVERHRDCYDLPFKEGGPAQSLQDSE
eukprot:3015697-Pleurochrysis_carterae.AAC.1